MRLLKHAVYLIARVGHPTPDFHVAQKTVYAPRLLILGRDETFVADSYNNVHE